MAIHNPKSNNDFNFMNSDTMPLDIRVKPEYDNEEIMPLDARIKYEHDKTDFNSINKDIIPLDTREGSEYDNLASSSLSFPCLTRESRNEESDFMSNDIMLTGCSGQRPSMTKGNNNLKMPEGNNNSKGIKGNNGTCVSIPCHSRAQTRESSFSQSGRSMVEMLGVLAVIGVLSIGGIMGYSYGMDKYRANETINDINLRAIDVITQISHGKEPNLSAEWGIMGRAGYPITLNTDYAPSQYFIKVENVPLKVCRLIMDAMPENINIWVNENDNKCQKELNMMEFEYTGFVKQGCTTSAECRIDTPVCNPDTGVCEPYPDDKACGGCPPEKPYCDESSGQCSSCKYDSDCPDNMLCLHKNEVENACLTYDFVPILSASESPDGREWIGLKVQSRYVQFDNAVKICKKYDKTLAYPNELTDSSGQKTDLTLAIQQVDGLHHTWSNQETLRKHFHLTYLAQEL